MKSAYHTCGRRGETKRVHHLWSGHKNSLTWWDYSALLLTVWNTECVPHWNQCFQLSLENINYNYLAPKKFYFFSFGPYWVLFDNSIVKVGNTIRWNSQLLKHDSALLGKNFWLAHISTCVIWNPYALACISKIFLG